MGLTITTKTCINCNQHKIRLEELITNKVRPSPKRGTIRIKFTCPYCEATMAAVYFDNHRAWGISYYCTNNDEPCYDEDCEYCAGNGKGWWRE